MPDYFESPEYRRILAAMCRRRADANRETVSRTGGSGGSLYMAQIYDACADHHTRQAALLDPAQPLDLFAPSFAARLTAGV